MTWHFPKRSPEQIGGNSQVAEFFGANRKVRPNNFVREAVQNALDAVGDANNGDPVSVLFRHGKLNRADSDDVRRTLLTPELREHIIGAELEALSTREQKDRRREELKQLFAENVDYLVVEDTGTTGLNGPVDMQVKIGGHDTNALTCFFRLNGLSGKTGKSLGSFGVGRHVFYSASKLTTFFIHTMPTDSLCIDHLVPNGLPTHRTITPCPMLLGMSLQQTHNTNDDEGRTIRFDNYLSYGVTSTADASKGVTIPIGIEDERSEEVEYVHELFDCRRPQGEDGTSIIILRPHANLMADKLIKAVVTDFALPVIQDRLIVTVDGRQIAEDTIEECAAEVEGKHAALIRFMKGAVRDAPDPLEIVLGPVDAESRYTEESFVDQDALRAHARAFRSGERVSVRVSMDFVDLKQGYDETTGSFMLHLEKTPLGQKGKVVIARSGLVIRGPSYTDGNFRREYNALLDLDTEDPLGNLLRRAEGPAHDEWKKTRIDDDCPESGAVIALVRDAGRTIASILLQHGHELDHAIFADLLPGGTSSGGGGGSGGGDGDGDGDGEGDGQRGGDRGGGGGSEAGDGGAGGISQFSFPESDSHLLIRIAPDTRVISDGDLIEVKVAYDTRVGSPFGKWRDIDFDLTGKAGSITQAGVGDMRIIDGQTIQVVARDCTNFQIGIPLELFDPDYDIRVRAERLGAGS